MTTNVYRFVLGRLEPKVARRRKRQIGKLVSAEELSATLRAARKRGLEPSLKLDEPGGIRINFNDPKQ